MDCTGDLLIWKNMREGNVGSLKALHDRYFIQLRCLAGKFVGDKQVAEELVSDCFLKLWMHRENILIEKSVKGYLFYMLRNRILDYLRKSKKSIIVDSAPLPDLPDDEITNEQDFYAELYRVIQRLPGQRRKILELAAFESMTYKEIAQKMNISVNTVKTQMGRAYQFMKEELDPKSFFFFICIAPGGN